MGYTSIPNSEGIAVAIGVSVSLCLVGVEYGVACARGRSVHGFVGSVANLACGVIHQVANLYYSSFIFPAYEFLQQRCNVANIEHFTIANGIVLFVLIDLIFYWEHRLLHWNRFLWATHLVHHESDEFNLTVSLRVSVLQVWLTTASTMLLALFGFPPPMALTGLLVYKFYQFWTHTRLIGNLGPMEWLFVTPSHHRVHHAKNERYLDKNFGGMLIIWDRMFGTFEPETEPPRYGVLERATPSFNPVLANVRPWLAFRRAGAMEWVRGAWLPAPVSWSMAASAVLRLVAVVGLTMALLLAESASGVVSWLVALPVSFVWLWQLGRLLEGQRVARRTDVASVVLAAVASAAVAGVPLVTGALLGGSLLVVIASLTFGRRRSVDDSVDEDEHETATSGMPCVSSHS